MDLVVIRISSVGAAPVVIRISAEAPIAIVWIRIYVSIGVVWIRIETPAEQEGQQPNKAVVP